MIGAPLPDQHPGLHEGTDTLLQKEGIALGPGNQERREGRQARVRSQQRCARTASALAARQRIEPQLRVVRSCCPSRAGTPGR